MADISVNVLKQVIEQALKPIIERLNDPKTGLGEINQKIDAVWDQTASLTEDMAEIKETQSLHTSGFKGITAKIENSNNNIRKLHKRVEVIEKKSGVVPPPEYIMV